MELIVSRPSGARVVQDYLAGTGEAPGFFARRFDDPEAFRAKALEVDGRFDRDARERAVEAIGVPDGADAGRLQRFVEEGGYMVTTGQQPALFGGKGFVHTSISLGAARQCSRRRSTLFR